MGTQKKITKQIVDDDGDFVLALKNNHGTFRRGVEQIFAQLVAGELTQVQPHFYAHDGERTWSYRDPTTLDD